MYSYFDPITRIFQMVSLFQQINDMFPNAHILVCEGSKYQWCVSEIELYAKNIHVLQMPYSLEGVHKSEGEAHILRNALKSDILQQLIKEHNVDRVFKLSGRYSFFENYDIEDHYVDTMNKIACSKRASCGEDSNGKRLFNTSTILYSFDVTCIPYIIERMEYVIRHGCQVRVIEELIWGEHVETLDPMLFKELDRLQFYGYIGVCGKLWYM
jgi:hypothetical protein